MLALEAQATIVNIWLIYIIYPLFVFYAYYNALANFEEERDLASYDTTLFYIGTLKYIA